MSISVLDNENGECDKLIEALKNRDKWHKKKMRHVLGTEYYRMGYGAGLGGFDPDDAELAGYDEIYPDYGQGLRDGRRALRLHEAAATK